MKKILLLFIFALILSGCIHINDSSNDNDIEREEETKEPVSHYGSDGDVYRINITTYNYEFPYHEELFTPATLNITEQDTTNVMLSDVAMEMRIRGNSTRAPEKKPFRIKFDKAQSLFGLEAAKDWVLLANYFDKTNIRNYLAYQLANKLSNLEYQPSSIFVDLYINDEYQGLYMLTEQMEANKGRVDIEDDISSKGISSFLIEADWRVIEEYPNLEGACYFRLDQYALKFKYPNCNKYLEAQLYGDYKFISEYERNTRWAIDFFKKAMQAVKMNDFESFSKYLDIDSFIDYYLVQEFFKNLDVGSTSQFYYIKQTDSPKISCGPVWDFDISAGVVATDHYDLYRKTELWVKLIDTFYSYLFKNATFNAMVEKRYTEERDTFLEVFKDFAEIKVKLENAQARNFERWPLPLEGERTSWIEIYAISDEYYALNSLEEHYAHLYYYLLDRLTLLDEQYLII